MASGMWRLCLAAITMLVAVAGDTAKCYDNGTPELTDSKCETMYRATPGKEVYAFSVPGSDSNYACCNKVNASKCTIIAAPGSLNPSEMFDCTPAAKSASTNSEPAASGSKSEKPADESGSESAKSKDDESNAKCYNNDTPGLTDSHCAMSFWDTPGAEAYAYSVPGSDSKYACCDKAGASKCTIIATPGGLNPGVTFACAPAPKTFAGEESADDDDKTARCYNNGTPQLTNGQCMLTYQHSPGREVHAFHIPESISKTACCDKANADRCTIIATPGGLNPGETFDCTPVEGDDADDSGPDETSSEPSDSTTDAATTTDATTTDASTTAEAAGGPDETSSEPSDSTTDAATTTGATTTDTTTAEEAEPETARCYNHGLAWLTYDMCEISFWATPGHEVYAYEVPGSYTKFACCDKASASRCYIIPTPFGLNAGQTLDCTHMWRRLATKPHDLDVILP